MKHLIDKDAVLAEIEKRINFNKNLNAHSRLDECNAILSFLDTLGVKEVDLDEQDIYAILYIEKEVWREYAGKDVSPVDICKEVLKRFKDFKERKEK